jgi:hypothetical protein
MNTRQLDNITKPDADHYRYEPLRPVYTEVKPKDHAAKWVDVTRGNIGLDTRVTPGLMMNEVDDGPNDGRHSGSRAWVL